MNAIFYAAAFLAVVVEWFLIKPEFKMLPSWIIAIIGLLFVGITGKAMWEFWKLITVNAGNLKKILVAIGLFLCQFVLAAVLKMLFSS